MSVFLLLVFSLLTQLGQSQHLRSSKTLSDVVQLPVDQSVISQSAGSGALDASIMQLDPTASALCDLISATDIESYFTDWVCTNSLTSTDYCAWSRITCNTNNEVTDLDLYVLFTIFAQLKGHVPDSICDITSLQTLKLGYNMFTGTVPQCIGSLSLLQSLSVESNYFTGPLIQNFTSTVFNSWRFSSNYFTGTISTTLSLPAMKYFYGRNNLLSGSLPSTLMDVTNMQMFVMSHNLLSGTIPAAFGNQLYMYQLQLDYNKLSGTIPASLGSTRLSYFCLNDNNLSGSVPSSFTSLSLYELLLQNNNFTGSLPALDYDDLLYIEVDNNQFTGAIPDANFVSPYPYSRHFTFSNNKFNGSLPSNILSYSYVSYFTAGGNKLTGTIPVGVASLSSLTVLRLNDNKLSGTLPSSFSTTALKTLDLSNNKLSGSLTGVFDQMSALTSADLSNNKFVGSISSAINALSALASLDLSHNNLGGTITEGLGSGTLTTISLNDNSLTGTLPVSLEYSHTLNLSHNLLSGSVEPSWSSISLVSLDLSHNAFTGTLSCLFSSLMSLSVGNNQLSSDACYLSCLSTLSGDVTHSVPTCRIPTISPSAIPSLLPSFNPTTRMPTTSSPSLYPTQSAAALETSTKAALCDLISNTDVESHLSGWVCSNSLSASEYCAWSGITCNSNSEMTGLNLRSYGIVGKVVDSICGITTLQILDLGLNGFSGTLPQCIGNLHLLQSLDVVNNDLSGPLIKSFSSSMLSWWKFSYNSFNGTISSALSLPAMVKFDGSHNSLTGPLPASLMDMTLLTYFELSSNMLTGTIPNTIANNGNLFYISLDSNKFSGTLPSFEARFLSRCYLNDNMFIGTLPSYFSTTYVYYFRVQNNRFSGTLPAFNFDWLFDFQVQNNRFTGTIPDTYVSGSYFSRVFSFSNNQFSGPLPNNIAALNYFTSFSADNNKLTGTIPTGLFSQYYMTSLLLNNNKLSGTLPNSYSTSQLRTFDLSNNEFTGTIPTLSTMYSLQYLDLSHNKFVAISEGLGSYGILTVELNNNLLTGTLPVSLAHTYYTLNVSHNLLSGPVTPSWSSAYVSSLDLSHNSFTGTLSTQFCSLSIYDLSIGGNLLSSDACYPACLSSDTGDVTQVLSLCSDPTVMPTLALTLTPSCRPTTAMPTTRTPSVHPSVSMNPTQPTVVPSFKPTYSHTLVPSFQPVAEGPTNSPISPDLLNGITTALCDIMTSTNIQDYYTEWDCSLAHDPTYYCNWSGIYCDQSEIQYLSLEGNSYNDDSALLPYLLHGTLPDSIGLITSLEELYIDKTSLTGTIPASIFNLTSLYFLVISQNYFTGSLPASMISSISYVFLSENALSGSIPESLLLPYGRFDVSYNLLTGTIPSQFVDTNGGYIFMSDNYLTGPISNVMSNSIISQLDLQSNYLSGTLPPCSATSLSLLRLGDNLFHGSVPSSYTNIGLNFLELQNNKLTGTLPAFDYDLLFYLDLSNNKLEGTIPEVPYSSNRYGMTKCIYLSNNLIEGTIPQGYGTLSTLLALYLDRNLLVGTIPRNISILQHNLMDLVLGDNKLTGTIPSSFASPYVTVLELGNNNFNGSLSDMFNSLIAITSLDVGHNKLTGTIPLSLSQLTYLVSCDMSSNQFIGPFPSQFDSLSYLVELDLGSNFLSGSLSEGLGSQAKLVLLSVDNNNLTGTIPSSLNHVRIFNGSHNHFTGPLIPDWEDALVAILDLSHNELSGSISHAVCDFDFLIQLYLSANEIESQSCYPGCLQLLGEDFYSTVHRCYDDQIVALCELATVLNVAEKEQNNVLTKVKTYETPHYVLGSLDDVQTFTDPDAYQYLISFSAMTYIGCSDTIKITWESGEVDLCGCPGRNCASYSGTGAYSLVAFGNWVKISTSLVDTSIVYGFYVTLTELTRGSGWTCTSERRRTDEGNQTSLQAFPCQWTGVTCTYEQVTGISLKGLNLQGTIPSSIGLLTTLTSLDMSLNVLTGTIPSSLGQLTSLSSLDLSSNSLSGTIPESFSSLPLSYLTLANNKLAGAVPGFFANMSLLSLIRLDANRFSGKLNNDVCGVVKSLHSISLINTNLDCYESCWTNYTGSTLFVRDSSLRLCAPTFYPTSRPSEQPSSQPSSYPTCPSSMPSSAPTSTKAPTFDSAATSSGGSKSGLSKQTITIASASAVGGVILIISCIVYIFYKYMRSKIKPSPEDIELTKMLSSCPIHKSILEQKPMTPDFVSRHIVTSTKKTPDNKTAFDLIIDAGEKYQADAVVVFLLLDHQLPDDLRNNRNAEDDCMTGNAAWCKIVQQHDERSLAVIGKVLTKYKSYVGILAHGKDEFGRKYINIASSKCKEAINRVLYLHERYELFDGPPEYKTKGSLIRFAYDHKAARRSSDLRGVTSKKVALKFISTTSSFKKETTSRVINAADCSKYYITVIESFDGDSDDPEHRAFRADSITKGYEDYPYCIVMDAAEQNLNRYINSQRISGCDWEEIRRVFKQLVTCVEYLHKHKVVHGDIKPNNAVVMANSGLRLIDFDNSSPFNTVSSTLKASTAYCPPEYFRVHVDVRDSSTKIVSRNDEAESFESNPSQDIWAMGVLLYLLCTGMSLFLANMDDNVGDDDDLHDLMEWSDSVRDRKLSKISDKLARNLASLMLMKNPAKRIDAARVLEHPFLSGKLATRMSGEKSEFDVFLSYRVSSDAYHVKLIYEALTKKGLKVWWDSKCLEAGKNWEIGFCEGLFKSDYFVCLVSKDGMAHATSNNLNWSMLTAESPCDNCVLEWMLALELQVRDLIKGVFPVFIGSTKNERTYDKFYLGPRDVADVSVASVEEKLKIHLDRQGCGLPYNLNTSVRTVVKEVTSNQGGFLFGELEDSVQDIAEKIVGMVRAAASAKAVPAEARQSVAGPVAVVEDIKEEVRTPSNVVGSVVEPTRMSAAAKLASTVSTVSAIKSAAKLQPLKTKMNDDDIESALRTHREVSFVAAAPVRRDGETVDEGFRFGRATEIALPGDHDDDYVHYPADAENGADDKESRGFKLDREIEQSMKRFMSMNH